MRDTIFPRGSPRAFATLSIVLLSATLVALEATTLTPVHAYTFSTSALSTATGFKGINFTQGFGGDPPDVSLAVGPTHAVEWVNNGWAAYLRNGTLVQVTHSNVTFNTGPDHHSLSDPKVLYDAASGRWFASILDTVHGNIAIAVSSSSDPTRTWKSYNNLTLGSADCQGGGACPDQPIIGVNDDKLVIGGDVRTGAKVWVINKSDLLAGVASPRLVSFGPFNGLGSVHPVQSLGSTATEYMVSVNNGDFASNSSYVKLFSISGVPGIGAGSAISNVTFQLSAGRTITGAVLSAIQKGPLFNPPSSALGLGDFRVQDAAWYKGKLWLGLNDNCIPAGDSTTRVCIRLVQLDTSSSSMVQEFDYGASSKYYFLPALRIDSMGNLAMIYGYSSVSNYPTLAVSGEAVNDPLQTLIAPAVIATSNAAYTGGAAYGDYFGAAVDPLDPSRVWVAGEYNRIPSGCGTNCGDPNWSTFISYMRVRASVSFDSTNTFLGFSVRTNGSLTVDSRLDRLPRLNGTVTAKASNSSTGQDLFTKTFTIVGLQLTNSSGVAPYYGEFVLTIAVDSCPSFGSFKPCRITSDVTITFSGKDATSNLAVSRDLDVDQNGTVDQSDRDATATAYGCSIGNQCYNPKLDFDANNTINVVDLAMVQSYLNAPAYV